MSTKTNFKRVALVAVAALGLGVLTSVAPASAAGVAIGNIVIQTPGVGTLAAAGVCVIDPKAQTTTLTTTRTQFSTATVVAKGASLTFQSTLDAGATLTITGPATWTSVSETITPEDLGPPIVPAFSTPDFTYNATATKVTVVNDPAAALLTTTGAGAVTVTVASALGGIDVIGITVVDSCSTATTFVAANTLVNLAHTGIAATGTDVLTAADKAYNSTVFVNLKLRNAYKGSIANGIITATATNGALISFDPLVVPGVASQAFLPGGSGNVSLSVKADMVTNPGKALSSVVTIAFNGVTVATKTVTIFGQASSIEISKVTVGTTNALGTGIGTFAYVTKDNAGNLVDSPAVLDVSSADALVLDGDIVSGTTALTLFSAAAPTTLGTGTFTCAAASTTSSGSEDTAIGFLTSALTVVKSASFKATCGNTVVNTFTAALDKAVYQAGEIATLTLTAKDANGGMVSDAAVVGILPATGISLGGMEPIGVVGTAADKYVSGVLTYKFRVINISSNEASYVGQAQVTAAVDLTPKTLQYKVVAGGSGVSNADVLKAIVSLIASINKQISALQKALLKKK